MKNEKKNLRLRRRPLQEELDTTMKNKTPNAEQNYASRKPEQGPDKTRGDAPACAGKLKRAPTPAHAGKAASSRRTPRKINALHIWKQFEDLVVPRLGLSVIDRAVYSHLLRHTHLEGKPRLRFSIQWLASAVRLTGGPTRQAVRRLVDQGALRLVERTKAGHFVEVRLPEEIRAARSGRIESGKAAHVPDDDLEYADFLKTRMLRRAIHAREQGSCFYCLRRITTEARCIDHVVPLAKLGRNSYRNLVSCCMECNSQKGERPAEDFLRSLYRERRLTAAELAGRLRALDDLARGKMRPTLQSEEAKVRRDSPHASAKRSERQRSSSARADRFA